MVPATLMRALSTPAVPAVPNMAHVSLPTCQRLAEAGVLEGVAAEGGHELDRARRGAEQVGARPPAVDGQLAAGDGR